MRSTVKYAAVTGGSQVSRLEKIEKNHFLIVHPLQSNVRLNKKFTRTEKFAWNFAMIFTPKLNLRK